jgi:diguanylate cyclase (GGDEF)-like protein
MKRLMIVEDEIIIADNIRSDLESFGYEVPCHAATGGDAVLKADEYRPDLVLMDINLTGGMDGIEAAGQIYSRFNIPIVYITSLCDDATVEKAKRTEPLGYLIKPFQSRDLKNTVMMACYKAEADNKVKMMVEKLKKNNYEMESTKKSFHNIVEKDNTGIIIIDIKGTICFANNAAKIIFNGENREIAGEEFGIPISSPDTVMEIDILCSDGATGVGELTVRETEWQGGKASLILIHDVTERRCLKEKLRELAYKDELTHLKNRRAFILLATQQLLQSQRAINKKCDAAIALLFIDLDSLKNINDKFGHHEGDRAIIAMAEALKKTFRKSDIIGRLGGDEFVVMAFETGAEEKITRDRLQRNVDLINEEKIYPFTLSFSLGLALYDPATFSTVEELMKIADKKMYKEKLNKNINRVAGRE